MARPKSGESKAELGFQMYLYGKKSKGEIADELNVSAGAVTEWAKKFRWDERKNELQTAPSLLKEQLIHLAAKVAKGEPPILEEGSGKVVDVKNLKQFVDMIDSLQEKEKVPFLHYYMSIKELLDFCVANNAEKQFLATLMTFQKKFLHNKL